MFSVSLGGNLFSPSSSRVSTVSLCCANSAEWTRIRAGREEDGSGVYLEMDGGQTAVAKGKTNARILDVDNVVHLGKTQ